MVDLVLRRRGQQPLAAEPLQLSLDVQELHGDDRRALDLLGLAGMERQPSRYTDGPPSVETMRGFIIATGCASGCRGRVSRSVSTSTRCSTPICGATSPTPGAAYMVSNMSLTSVLTEDPRKSKPGFSSREPGGACRLSQRGGGRRYPEALGGGAHRCRR